jgi:hypothetical protein
MKISLMFTGADDVLQKCRPLRRQVMDLVSSVVATNDYGTTLELLLVNVVIQDTRMLRLGTRLSRETKDIGVDIPLSRKWAKQARNPEIKRALLESLIKAVEITKLRLTRKDDDFKADELITDLKAIVDTLERIK